MLQADLKIQINLFYRTPYNSVNGLKIKLQNVVDLFEKNENELTSEKNNYVKSIKLFLKRYENLMEQGHFKDSYKRLKKKVLNEPWNVRRLKGKLRRFGIAPNDVIDREVFNLMIKMLRASW